MARSRLPAHERRATIVQSARYMFLRHGYGGATTRAIARHAGVTEAVLYQYFASKEDLFDETMVKPISGNAEALLAKMSALTVAAAGDDARTTLIAERELLAEVVRLVPGIGALFYSEPEVGAQLYRDFMIPHFERATKDTTAALDGVAAERVELFLTLAYGMNLGLALHQRFSDEPMDDAAIARTVTRLVQHGTEGARGR